MNTTETLLDMKERIKQAEIKKAQSEGRLEQLMADLKKLGFDNLQQVVKKLKSMDKEIVKLDKEIANGVEKLERDYDWE